jgi:hypothetical protein
MMMELLTACTTHNAEFKFTLYKLNARLERDVPPILDATERTVL